VQFAGGLEQRVERTFPVGAENQREIALVFLEIGVVNVRREVLIASRPVGTEEFEVGGTREATGCVRSKKRDYCFRATHRRTLLRIWWRVALTVQQIADGSGDHLRHVPERDALFVVSWSEESVAHGRYDVGDEYPGSSRVVSLDVGYGVDEAHELDVVAENFVEKTEGTVARVATAWRVNSAVRAQDVGEFVLA
jgi:hypothetical protein